MVGRARDVGIGAEWPPLLLSARPCTTDRPTDRSVHPTPPTDHHHTPHTTPPQHRNNDDRRQWYLRGVACGGDASWGILGTCMRELNVSFAELEDPRWMVLDSAAPQRWVFVCARGIGRFDDRLARPTDRHVETTKSNTLFPLRRIHTLLYTHRRMDLLNQLGNHAANGPALLGEVYGPPGWGDAGGQAACSVHIPSAEGHGPHATVRSGAFFGGGRGGGEGRP